MQLNILQFVYVLLGCSSETRLTQDCSIRVVDGRYQLTLSTSTIGCFILWIVFVFGGDLVFGGVACCCFFFFFFVFVLLFEMAGSTCRSVGDVCVFFVFGLVVFVGVISIGGVAVVIVPCFCCFFLSCFSIASTKAKSWSQMSQ